jgi:hypothetical protein
MMATEKPIGSNVHRFVGVKDMASGGEYERAEASTSEVRNRSNTHLALLSTHKNSRRPRCAACRRRAEGGFPTRQLARSRYPSTHLRLPLETSGGVGTAEPGSEENAIFRRGTWTTRRSCSRLASVAAATMRTGKDD